MVYYSVTACPSTHASPSLSVSSSYFRIGTQTFSSIFSVDTLSSCLLLHQCIHRSDWAYCIITLHKDVPFRGMYYVFALDTFIVDAEWLSGRMPDSRAREHRHESSYGLHIGAVDGDSLWRCYAMTTQNHCTCYFVINRDLFMIYLISSLRYPPPPVDPILHPTHFRKWNKTLINA